MRQSICSQHNTILDAGMYSCFSGASDALTRSLHSRNRSVQLRIAKQREKIIQDRVNAFLMRRAVYRVGLLSGTTILIAISARIGNHVIYFASGVDHHILEGVANCFSALI